VWTCSPCTSAETPIGDHAAAVEFAENRALDGDGYPGPRVVDRGAHVLDHVRVGRGDGDGALSGRGDELLAGESGRRHLVEQLRTPEPRLREDDDGVVLRLDLPLHRRALEVRERVEPLLDGAIELLVDLVGVGALVVRVVIVASFRRRRARLAGRDQPPLVFRLQVGREQLLDPGVDVAPAAARRRGPVARP